MDNRLGLALYGLALVAFTVATAREINRVRKERIEHFNALRDDVWERRARDADHRYRLAAMDDELTS